MSEHMHFFFVGWLPKQRKFSTYTFMGDCYYMNNETGLWSIFSWRSSKQLQISNIGLFCFAKSFIMCPTVSSGHWPRSYSLQFKKNTSIQIKTELVLLLRHTKLIPLSHRVESFRQKNLGRRSKPSAGARRKARVAYCMWWKNVEFLRVQWKKLQKKTICRK